MLQDASALSIDYTLAYDSVLDAYYDADGYYYYYDWNSGYYYNAEMDTYYEPYSNYYYYYDRLPATNITITCPLTCIYMMTFRPQLLLL